MSDFEVSEIEHQRQSHADRFLPSVSAGVEPSFDPTWRERMGIDVARLDLSGRSVLPIEHFAAMHPAHYSDQGVMGSYSIWRQSIEFSGRAFYEQVWPERDYDETLIGIARMFNTPPVLLGVDVGKCFDRCRDEGHHDCEFWHRLIVLGE